MAEKRLRTLEGLGLQAVWSSWVPLGVIDSQVDFFWGPPTPHANPKIKKTPRHRGGRRQGSWLGAALWGPNPVFLPCLDSVALTVGLSPSLPGWCREVSRASPGY